MIILLLLIMGLGSLVFCIREQTQDQLRMEQTGFVKTVQQFTLPEIGGNAVYPVLESLSDEYDCTFIREEVFEENGRLATRRTVLPSQDYFEIVQMELAQGNLPENPGEFISTWRTENPNQTGLLRDPFADAWISVGVMDSDEFRQMDDAGGSWFLCCGSDQAAAILDQLAARLNLDPDELTNINYTREYTESSEAIFAAGILVLLMLFVLMCLYYPLSRLRQIGIWKLMGLSGWILWKKLMLSVFLWGFAGAAVSSIVPVLLFQGLNLSFFLHLFFWETGLLMFCVILSIFMLISARRYTLNSLIKGEYHGRLAYWFSLLIKLAAALILTALIPTIAKLIEQSVRQISMYSAYQEVSNLMTISEYDYSGREFQDRLEGDHVLGNKLKAMFYELEKTADAMYVQSYSYDAQFFASTGLSAVQEAKLPICTMQLNENGLNLYRDFLSEDVSEYFRNSEITLIIPEQFLNTPYQKMAEDAVLYPFRVQGNEPDWSVMTYPQSNQEIFSQNYFMINEGQAFIQNPVFVGLKGKALDEMLLLENQAITNPMRIADTSENQSAIRNAIRNQGLEENHIEFKSIFDTGFVQSMKTIKTSMMLIATAIIFITAVSLLSSWYLALVILTIRQKKLMVQKTMGHSFIKRYRSEMETEALIWLISFCFLITLKPVPLGFLIYFLFLITDFLTETVIIRRNENKVLLRMLKGEDS